MYIIHGLVYIKWLLNSPLWFWEWTKFNYGKVKFEASCIFNFTPPIGKKTNLVAIENLNIKFVDGFICDSKQKDFEEHFKCIRRHPYRGTILQSMTLKKF